MWSEFIVTYYLNNQKYKKYISINLREVKCGNSK